MTQRVLENRCAIVTGASEGLGFEIARRYLAAGANVTICARTESALSTAAAALEASAGAGRSVTAVPADVSKPAHAVALVDEALKAHGRVDILVNNAGVAGPGGSVESVDWDAVDADDRSQLVRIGLAEPRTIAAPETGRTRKDHSIVGRRRDESLADVERIRRFQGGGRPLRRNACRGNAPRIT